MKQPKVYHPCITQWQADAMQHAAHDETYRAEKNIPRDVAEGRHVATVATGLWGKRVGSPCPKCHTGCAHVHLGSDGYCADCGNPIGDADIPF